MKSLLKFNNYLIIKNTIWFWKRDIYLLTDIKEVVIETPHRLSTSLRIITTDYRDKLYPAGSLSDKTWKKMMEQLRNDKIKVRNVLDRNKYSLMCGNGEVI